MEDLIDQLSKIPEITVVAYLKDNVIVGYSVCRLENREQFYKELKRTE